MIARDPLGAPARLATDAAGRLGRAVAVADGQWVDGARREFDRRHLDRITSDADGLAAGLSGLADRCRIVATRIEDTA